LDHWNQWENTSYPGYTQINIQNQWDISDYPCFSKFFITFPLVSIPPSQVILTATVKMYLFGGSGGDPYGDPPDSYIQVFTVAEDWNEATLTWNNAPLAVENISGTWVHPLDGIDWVGYTWDVSRGVAQAHTAGEPLRLAFYSTDGERHAGKYFFSSDVDDYLAEIRPTLVVTSGLPCSSPGIQCHFFYLPLSIR
jgi:hypothetical protein